MEFNLNPIYRYNSYLNNNLLMNSKANIELKKNFKEEIAVDVKNY